MRSFPYVRSEVSTTMPEIAAKALEQKFSKGPRKIRRIIHLQLKKLKDKRLRPILRRMPAMLSIFSLYGVDAPQ